MHAKATCQVRILFRQVKTTSVVESLDSLNDHFSIVNASKIPGKIPSSILGGGGLKFSIKDTLHLLQGAYFPIKFLHDASSDVTGIFLQVVGAKGGMLSASGYFDVPEVPDMDNDTVSVVLVSFDPTIPGLIDVELPVSFNIKIIPHDDNNQPLDAGTIPVVVDNINGNVNSGICGLTDGYWQWICSFSGLNGTDPATDAAFYNDPEKVWGRSGQVVMGCCCDGKSIYNNICPCSPDNSLNASLHFSTYSQYKEEALTFFENGIFFRQTVINAASPIPDSSNFCSNAGGITHERSSYDTYGGDWIVKEVSIPANLQEMGFPAKYNSVALNQTTAVNGGYGNPGGVLSNINCGFLVLIQLDLEGFGQDLWKIYERKSNFQGEDEDDWYDIPES